MTGNSAAGPVRAAFAVLVFSIVRAAAAGTLPQSPVGPAAGTGAASFTYANAKVGLTFPVPAGWHVATDRETRALLPAGMDVVGVDDPAVRAQAGAIADRILLMISEQPFGSEAGTVNRNIIVAALRMEEVRREAESAEEYLGLVARKLKASLPAAAAAEVDARILGGSEFRRLAVSFPARDVTVHIWQLARVHGDHLLVVNMTGSTAEQLEGLAGIADGMRLSERPAVETKATETPVAAKEEGPTTPAPAAAPGRPAKKDPAVNPVPIFAGLIALIVGVTAYLIILFRGAPAGPEILGDHLRAVLRIRQASQRTMFGALALFPLSLASGWLFFPDSAIPAGAALSAAGLLLISIGVMAACDSRLKTVLLSLSLEVPKETAPGERPAVREAAARMIAPALPVRYVTSLSIGTHPPRSFAEFSASIGVPPGEVPLVSSLEKKTGRTRGFLFTDRGVYSRSGEGDRFLRWTDVRTAEPRRLRETNKADRHFVEVATAAGAPLRLETGNDPKSSRLAAHIAGLMVEANRGLAGSEAVDEAAPAGPAERPAAPGEKAVPRRTEAWPLALGLGVTISLESRPDSALSVEDGRFCPGNGLKGVVLPKSAADRLGMAGESARVAIRFAGSPRLITATARRDEAAGVVLLGEDVRDEWLGGPLRLGGAAVLPAGAILLGFLWVTDAVKSRTNPGDYVWPFGHVLSVFETLIFLAGAGIAGWGAWSLLKLLLSRPGVRRKWRSLSRG